MLGNTKIRLGNPKNHILAVGARLMLEQGYRDTAMKQIASLHIYRVGEEEIEQILAFVRSLDVNKLADDVMQQLFEQLEIYFESDFSDIHSTARLGTCDKTKRFFKGILTLLNKITHYFICG